MQCWEKLKGRFPEAEKERASLRSYFRVLCFRAEAVSELVLYAHLAPGPQAKGLEFEAGSCFCDTPLQELIITDVLSRLAFHV